MSDGDISPAVRVSIGIPAYNRARTLERAIRSALAQDHPNVEVLVCDDASTDGTERLCGELSAQHTALRYIRSPHNIGLTANFLRVLELARGEYFMWLSDDDWLDRNYVSACLRELGRNPHLAQVCGTPVIYQDAVAIEERTEEVCAEQADAEARVLNYYRAVTRNTMLYGLARRATLQRAQMPNLLGGDFLHSAAVAFQGGVRTIVTTRFHRSLGGTSKTMRQVVRVFQLPAWHGWLPNLSMCLASALDILGNDSAYRTLPRRRRAFFAAKVFGLLAWKRILLGSFKTWVVSSLIALFGEENYRSLRNGTLRPGEFFAAHPAVRKIWHGKPAH